MKKHSDEKLINSLEGKFSTISKNFKLETLPPLISLIKERFELLNRMATIMDEYELKNLDTLLDIAKVILTVLVSLLAVSTAFPILQKNSSQILSYIYLSGVFIGIIFIARSLLVKRLIKHLGELEKLETETYDSISSTLKTIMDVDNLFFSRRLNRIQKKIKKHLGKR